VHNGSLRLPGLDPFADAIPVFDGDAAPGALRFGNDLLTDMVIDPGSEASLLSGEQPQGRRLAARATTFRLGSWPAQEDPRTGIGELEFIRL
jgi:hypothetical protein